MSRIEEALRRARGDSEPASRSDAAVAGLPDADIFQAPWAFDAPDVQAAAVGERTPIVPFPEKPVATAATVDARQDPLRGEPPATADPATTKLALFSGFDPLVAERIVVTSSVRPAFVEQYRKLAGTLHHAQLERNIRTVLVTSSLASEGKSLTSTNLSLTLAESYHRSVLLIDADMRRPSLHDMFRVPNVSGLGDGLRADGDQKLPLLRITPRLTLLTAGRPDPDPVAGLSSERMRRVFQQAAGSFDWVIVDTPPVGLLPDARLLAGMADATLLVVEAGRTSYELVQRAVEVIGRERILGVVFNRAEAGVGVENAYYNYYDNYSRRRR